ncbi:pentapeptide repeat-containing protein [Jiangella gansuensis]|uniref:pentapeptide repeat-containing protein n=1 Tax=Jiangella gansuensis TaxID=281473 RepID=UPI000A035860|nr:pentapeptide repeat-containing protein [Jiangella gansuensis]
MKTTLRTIAAAVPVAIVGLGALWLVLGPLANALTATRGLTPSESVAALADTRQAILTGLGGLGLLIGVAFTARTYLLNRRAQLTDRLARSVEQLASGQLAVRLGGVYALEQLMRESKQEHEAAVDVLAAFVRENASYRNVSAGGSEAPVMQQEESQEPEISRLPTDVQSVLTVLGRRPVRHESHRLDLAETDLRGADLRGARFDRADLSEALLNGSDLSKSSLVGALLNFAQLVAAEITDADMSDASLRGAKFQEARMTGVVLRGADPFKARFSGATLEGVDLRKSSIDRAYLMGANLRRANLRDEHLYANRLEGVQLEGADLRGTQIEGDEDVSPQLAERLRRARTDTSTRLPPGM